MGLASPKLYDKFALIARVKGTAKVKGDSFRGFNLSLDPDYRLFLTLGRSEWVISDFRAADLRAYFPDLTPRRSSYLLKRLRTHGLIKKVGHCHKYYLTKLGRRALVSSLILREYFILPSLAKSALCSAY